MHSPSTRRSPLFARALAPLVAVLATALLVAGCGDKKKDKAAATQTAAKVNKEEITVHQINLVLSQQPLPPEQAASATSQVLERLIDQELALQKAAEQKLDRDPRVMQQIEASRRDIIARAYLEKIGEGAPKPTPAEVSAYFEAHPALFAARRIYNLQELDLEAPPAQMEQVKAALSGSKSFLAFVDWLKANNVRFHGTEAVRPAEQLPLASVEQFAALKDGQAVFISQPDNRARVINLVSSRTQPVTSQAAIPVIETYLQNERKRKLVADDLHALRAAAKIEYLGNFAANRPPEQPSPPPDAPPLTSIAPPAASAVLAAPQSEVAPREPAAASMPGSTLDKGLKGLK
ncbi:MAG: EpsD family peptidyl-prolyl cis-trans isomerase [Pseudomonadota bacterium]|nr:EpsD family peptidyl-prolyl cis-trans isomerase [Pseudomonadota bacterium]